MISGQVDENLEPVLRLTVRNESGEMRTWPFVIDTGFNGTLTLPPRLIADLKLNLHGEKETELADGSVIRCRVFFAQIEWDGVLLELNVDESNTVPLLGTSLLRGYQLTAEMRPHGKLTLKKLPPKKRKARS
jgi:clan AA aspartic protease